MTKTTTTSSSVSKLEKQHAEMLEKALRRPGIREAMNVFYGWQNRDQILETYRSATIGTEQMTTTNHTNIL